MALVLVQGGGSWLCRLGCILALVGCGQEGIPRSDRALPLAHGGGLIDCGEFPEAPSFEVWAGAADLVVFGTVTGLRPLWEPAIMSRGDAEPPWVDADQCNGFIENGLEIDLGDLEVLVGDFAASTLTVSFGKYMAESLYPAPRGDWLGRIDWEPQDAPGRIEPGQRIGGVLYRDPAWGFWGPQKNEGIFLQLDLLDRIRVQGYLNQQCFKPVPEGLEGLSLEEFRGRLTSLDLSDPRVQEEIARRRDWGDDAYSSLYQYWGALCFPRPECDQDADCDPGELCRDGWCGSECAASSDCDTGERCLAGHCQAP